MKVDENGGSAQNPTTPQTPNSKPQIVRNLNAEFETNPPIVQNQNAEFETNTQFFRNQNAEFETKTQIGRMLERFESYRSAQARIDLVVALWYPRTPGHER